MIWEFFMLGVYAAAALAGAVLTLAALAGALWCLAVGVCWPFVALTERRRQRRNAPGGLDG